MNLATIRTTITRNKRGLMIAGAAAVGALALLARKKAGGDVPAAAAGPSGSSASPASAGYTSSGGYTTYAPYDSSGSDVYGAIQPQLEELRDLFGQIPSAVGEAVAGAVPAAGTSPYAATGGDSRREAIAGFYTSILGRDPHRSEVNFWDSAVNPDKSSKTIDEIRAAILRSPEAQKTSR